MTTHYNVKKNEKWRNEVINKKMKKLKPNKNVDDKWHMNKNEYDIQITYSEIFCTVLINFIY